MQEANRSRTEFIREISRYSLIGLLIINILSPFAILFINPEAYLFGQKIAGTSAVVYALGFILVTVLVMVCLFQKTKGNEVIALVYGVIYFISGYLNVLNITGQSPPAIYWLVLAVSVFLSGATLLNASGGPAGKYGKSISTVFTEKPFARVLVIIAVFFCFLLYSSIVLLTYEKEYNSYVYQIEIEPAASLHNVTLMVPIPSRISQNITDGDLVGSSLPDFTNYSQSVVETENGTMIRITADSIEKPETGSPDHSIRLYQSIAVTGPVNPVNPLDREPMLFSKYPPEPSSCTDKTFRGIAFDKRALNCSVYESGIFASFWTSPASQTIITVSVERERMISSSQSPRREGYQESIRATITGSADGWYNASGNLLTG